MNVLAGLESSDIFLVLTNLPLAKLATFFVAKPDAFISPYVRSVFFVLKPSTDATFVPPMNSMPSLSVFLYRVVRFFTSGMNMPGVGNFLVVGTNGLKNTGLTLGMGLTLSPGDVVTPMEDEGLPNDAGEGDGIVEYGEGRGLDANPDNGLLPDLGLPKGFAELSKGEGLGLRSPALIPEGLALDTGLEDCNMDLPLASPLDDKVLADLSILPDVIGLDAGRVDSFIEDGEIGSRGEYCILFLGDVCSDICFSLVGPFNQ